MGPVQCQPVSGSVWMRLVFCCGSKSSNSPLSGLSKTFGAVQGFYRAPALVKDKTTFHCCEFWFYRRYFSYFSVNQEHGPQEKNSNPTPPHSILNCRRNLSSSNCRESRRIPDLTKGYRLETETLTNKGQSINM